MCSDLIWQRSYAFRRVNIFFSYPFDFSDSEDYKMSRPDRKRKKTKSNKTVEEVMSREKLQEMAKTQVKPDSRLYISGRREEDEIKEIAENKSDQLIKEKSLNEENVHEMAKVRKKYSRSDMSKRRAQKKRDEFIKKQVLEHKPEEMKLQEKRLFQSLNSALGKSNSHRYLLKVFFIFASMCN